MNEIEKAQLAKTTVQCFTGLVGDLEDFPDLLRKVIEERVWERRIHNGRLYELSSLRELVTRKPPEGWGQNPDKIEAVIRDNHEVHTLYAEEMKEKTHNRGNQHTGGKVDNVNLARKGNSRAYTLSRLKRENADLFQQVVAGELSANAAAIKAGWRKVKSPVDIIRSTWPKLTDDEQTQLLEWIESQAKRTEQKVD
jgi:hypothetical protein